MFWKVYLKFLVDLENDMILKLIVLKLLFMVVRKIVMNLVCIVQSIGNFWKKKDMVGGSDCMKKLFYYL